MKQGHVAAAVFFVRLAWFDDKNLLRGKFFVPATCCMKLSWFESVRKTKQGKISLFQAFGQRAGGRATRERDQRRAGYGREKERTGDKQIIC